MGANRKTSAGQNGQRHQKPLEFDDEKKVLRVGQPPGERWRWTKSKTEEGPEAERVDFESVQATEKSGRSS